MTAAALYAHVRNDGAGCLSVAPGFETSRHVLRLDVGARLEAPHPDGLPPIYAGCWLPRAAAGALALALLSPGAKAEADGLELWHHTDDCDGCARLYPLFGGFSLEARDEGLEAVRCLLATDDAAEMAARLLEWCSSQDAAL